MLQLIGLIARFKVKHISRYQVMVVRDMHAMLQVGWAS